MKRIRSRLNPNTKKRWEKKYSKYINDNYIRSDSKHLLKFMHLFEGADSILDFGSGLGGNVQYLASQLMNTRFVLIDHSETSLEYVRNKMLGTEDEKGSGIGLILCKEFTELNLGTISVESTFGKGSKFILRLPSD